MSQPAAKSPAELDQLCINTIRTLSMDAVQKANSGHPGTPMALAPVAFHLWQNHLRYDPDEPLWPNRDRFVLSVGHASMLLYSLLHLAGVKAVDEHGKPTDAPAVSLDDIKQFRQLDSKTPGHPEYRMTTGVETTTGPLGQGLGNSVGMAMAARWHEAHFNKPDCAAVRLPRLRAVRRRRHDGRRVARGGIARGASEALEPDLDLRQQPHHDRRPHGPRLQRRRGIAFPGLQLEHDARRRRQRRSRARSRDQQGEGDHRPADADRREEHHRLGRAEQAGHVVGARRSARRRGSQAREDARTAGRKTRSSSCPTACTNASREAWARAARRRATNGRSASTTTARSIRELAQGIQRRCSASQLPDGWDADIPVFEADAKGIATRESSGKVLNAIAAAHSVDDRRCGGSLAVDENQSQVRRRRQFRARQLRRPQPALRHPRARHGRGRQRPRALGLAAVRVHVPDFQRLHEAADPALRDHGSAGRSTCSRTIRSASARTVRRISRSSNSPRCAACRG